MVADDDLAYCEHLASKWGLDWSAIETGDQINPTVSGGMVIWQSGQYTPGSAPLGVARWDIVGRGAGLVITITGIEIRESMS